MEGRIKDYPSWPSRSNTCYSFLFVEAKQRQGKDEFGITKQNVEGMGRKLWKTEYIAFLSLAL